MHVLFEPLVSFHVLFEKFVQIRFLKFAFEVPDLDLEQGLLSIWGQNFWQKTSSSNFLIRLNEVIRLNLLPVEAIGHLFNLPHLLIARVEAIEYVFASRHYLSVTC